MSAFDDEIDNVETPLVPDTNEGEGATPDNGIVPTPSEGQENQPEEKVEEVFTIEKYLKGKVKLTISDEALQTILADAETEKDTPFAELEQKQKDLATAYLYAYVATSPSQSARIKDSDGNWSHEEGSETIDAATRRHFLILANDLFKKYNLATIGSSSWGVSGRGFGHIRNYGSR